MICLGGRRRPVGDNDRRLGCKPHYSREDRMVDQHQVNSIIATAICDARKNHPDGRMDPEEAKQIAKCIVEALADARLEIVPVSKD
jgi:hypothetical protein